MLTAVACGGTACVETIAFFVGDPGRTVMLVCSGEMDKRTIKNTTPRDKYLEARILVE